VETILVHARTLVYTLVSLMPTPYQRDNLQAILGLFLQADGRPLPEYSQFKSASALSRFLNQNRWSTRQVIRVVRRQMLQQLVGYTAKGRRPWLQVIVDLTTLDKCGKFKNFQHLIHVFNGKRGLHLVVLYLVVGYCRVPWGFRVWRGKDTPSPAQLALRLIDTLPKKLTKVFRVIVLADTAFGSVDFLKSVPNAPLSCHCWGALRPQTTGRSPSVRPVQTRTTGVLGGVILSRDDFLVIPQAGWQTRETICPLHSPPQGQYYHLVGETSLGN
jgi:hypothetical protein